MPTVEPNNYVIVNIWTSDKYEPLPGANVGHASITTSTGQHVSLWPGKRSEDNSHKIEFFQPLKSNFIERPPVYRQDYEQDCVIEAFHENHYRMIDDINELREGEKLYQFDSTNHSFQQLKAIPRSCPETHCFLAMRLLPANFRVVLFSLNIDKIETEFDFLKEDVISGWSLAGSNLLTRNFNQKTTENCASLVYRCLRAGGLYDKLKSQLPSETFSAVAPNNLLRHLVAAKERELRDYQELNMADWSIEGVVETPLEEIKEAFEKKKLNANAEDDFFPSLKPSGVECVLL